MPRISVQIKWTVPLRAVNAEHKASWCLSSLLPFSQLLGRLIFLDSHPISEYTWLNTNFKMHLPTEEQRCSHLISFYFPVWKIRLAFITILLFTLSIYGDLTACAWFVLDSVLCRGTAHFLGADTCSLAVYSSLCET